MEKKIIITLLFTFLILNGCDNSKSNSSNKVGNIILPNSLKEATMYTVVPNESDYKKFEGVPSAEYYYYYKNRNEIKSTLTLSDSMRIESFSVVFYSFKIKEKEFFNTQWFLNIDGHYLPKGIYISQYSDNDNFSYENQELVKAIGKKIEAWENKSTKKWW